MTSPHFMLHLVMVWVLAISLGAAVILGYGTGEVPHQMAEVAVCGALGVWLGCLAHACNPMRRVGGARVLGALFSPLLALVLTGLLVVPFPGRDAYSDAWAYPVRDCLFLSLYTPMLLLVIWFVAPRRQLPLFLVGLTGALAGTATLIQVAFDYGRWWCVPVSVVLAWAATLGLGLLKRRFETCAC